MNRKDRKMSRLEAWFCGELEDDDLTDEEIRELDVLVKDAVSRKILQREGVHTFPAHGTLQ